MLNRTCPYAEPEIALTHTEIDLLKRLVKGSKRSRAALPLSRYFEKNAPLAATSHAPTIQHQGAQLCGEACTGWPICS